MSKKVDPELLLAVIIEAELLDDEDTENDEEIARVEELSGRIAKKIMERFAIKPEIVKRSVEI